MTILLNIAENLKHIGLDGLLCDTIRLRLETFLDKRKSLLTVSSRFGLGRCGTEASRQGIAYFLKKTRNLENYNEPQVQTATQCPRAARWGEW